MFEPVELSWILASLAGGSACALSARSRRSVSLPNCVLALRWALAIPALSVASSLPSCATLSCKARVESATTASRDWSRIRLEVAAAPAMAPSATASAIAAASGSSSAGRRQRETCSGAALSADGSFVRGGGCRNGSMSMIGAVGRGRWSSALRSTAVAVWQARRSAAGVWLSLRLAMAVRSRLSGFTNR